MTAGFGALNERQKAAVEACDGHELVLAGAGSGKTRVLTVKIAHLIRDRGVAPWRIMAVTFTNKAAREMLSRVTGMVGENLRGMQVCTFHSWGLRFLRRHPKSLEELGYPADFVIFDRADCRSLIKKIAKEHDFEASAIGGVIEGVSKAYAECDPRTLEADVDESLRGVYEAYRASLKAQGALDFDDLMILPLHLLITDPALLSDERGRVEWILVDEYQDVNRPQHTLLKLLAGDANRVMAVGDPDQSIYGWRGADMSLIMNFERDFPKARVFVLDQNYRSSGSILEAANEVIRNNFNRREKNLWTSSEKGDKVTLVKFGNDIGESEFIADEIERLVSGSAGKPYDYGDICVLYRINALSRVYEQSLLERGIPYRVVRGTSFYERREIKDVLAMLRLSVNPKDQASLERVANIPPRGLGQKSVSQIAAFLMDAEGTPDEIWDGLGLGARLKGRAAEGAADMSRVMLKIRAAPSLKDAVDCALYDAGYADWLMGEYHEDYADRLENVRELVSIMPDGGNIADALAEAAIYTDQETADAAGPQVNLLTLHASKGLEFPVVFVAGMEEGVFPTSRVLDEDAGDDSVEEERRLCYVGMTRARERLYLSGAKKRRLFGHDKISKLSRFTDELPGTVRTDDRTARGEGSYVFGGNHGRNWRW
ncbi:MAG: UvrD-helicase domain-containing protein [Synergistaceae bacterium]|jgi:DNA helicase-2/ATP-dependent DNA helicase PcrA|nr:UvrD-helicase domain-containing protein [Synergistaceae bacterium]